MASVIVMTSATPTAKAGDVCTTGGLPSGQTAYDTIQPVCELSVNQPVVGQGQYVLVNTWISPATLATRAIDHYVFTITAPDGTKTTWNQNSELATAATWYDYTLTQLGTYTFSSYFTGCYFNGTSGNATATASALYLPASAQSINVTCQASLVSSWPLDNSMTNPPSYWTRPVDFSHRTWWPELR